MNNAVVAMICCEIRSRAVDHNLEIGDAFELCNLNALVDRIVDQRRRKCPVATMSSVDRGYTNLLAVLRSRPTSIPFNALVAGISHFLAHSPSTQPSPTPLAETVIQSPIWQSHSLKQYIDLGNAFGQALLTKRKEQSEEKRGLFSASLSFSLQQWINSILEGVKSGSPLARLDIYRGLLLGIDSLEDADKLLGRRIRERIGKSAVLAFAETIDQSREEANKVWLEEFKPGAESPEGANINIYARAWSSLFSF